MDRVIDACKGYYSTITRDSTMNTFFDLNGRLGRWDYFKTSFARLLIVVLAYASYHVISYLVSSQFNSEATPQLFGDWLKEQVEVERQTAYQVDTFVLGLLQIPIFVPIVIRRANDFHLKVEWLIPTYTSFLIPWNLIDDTSFGLALFVLFNIYCLVIGAILQFKPGETFKEWVRSKDQPA